MEDILQISVDDATMQNLLEINKECLFLCAIYKHALEHDLIRCVTGILVLVSFKLRVRAGNKNYGVIK